MSTINNSLVETNRFLFRSSCLPTDRQTCRITRIGTQSLQAMHIDDSIERSLIQGTLKVTALDTNLGSSLEIDDQEESLDPHDLASRCIIPILRSPPQTLEERTDLNHSITSKTPHDEELSFHFPTCEQTHAVHRLAIEILGVTGKETDISFVLQFAQKILLHDQSKESYANLIQVISKILPKEERIEIVSEYLETLQKKAILEEDFSILNHPDLKILSQEEFFILQYHLIHELRDTKSFFKMILETNNETDPSKKIILLTTLNHEAKAILENATSLSKFRYFFFEPIQMLIQNMSIYKIDLSEIKDLKLLSSPRKNWILPDRLSTSSISSHHYILEIGTLGEGSFNKIQLVWDTTASCFYAMRSLKEKSRDASVLHTKIQHFIQKSEDIFKACSFHESITTPGTLIQEKIPRDILPLYTSLEEIAIHQDLSKQIPLFQQNPRSLTKQLLKQFIALQESHVGLGDIKPSNINVYEIDGKITLKYGDLDGSWTKESLKKSLEEQWNKLCEKLEYNEDKIKGAFKALSPPYTTSDISLSEFSAFLSFIQQTSELIKPVISPGYSFGNIENALSFQQHISVFLLQKLSELSLEEDHKVIFSHIVDDTISSLQQVDLRCLGTTLFEMLTNSSDVNQPLIYLLLQHSSKGQLISMSSSLDLPTHETVTSPPLTRSSIYKTIPDTLAHTFLDDSTDFSFEVSKKEKFNLPIKYVRMRKRPFLRPIESQNSPSTEILKSQLKHNLNNSLDAIPEDLSLPKETSTFILDLINGDILNNESGFARLKSFYEQL